jgi:hypothetical protein
MPVTVDEAIAQDILRVLCRIPVQHGQLVLYWLALQDPSVGCRSSQLKEMLGLVHAQHRGLMAALTMRINNTPRLTGRKKKPGLGLLFRQRWDGKENVYRPRPELEEAVRRLPKLAALMKATAAEVLASPGLTLSPPQGSGAGAYGWSGRRTGDAGRELSFRCALDP